MLIRHTPSPRCTVFVCLVAFALGLPTAGKSEEDRAVAAGVQYLRGHAGGRGAGEAAMIALALLKAEVPPSDTALQGCLATIRSRFTTGSYEPALGPGPGTYEAAATVMVLTNLDATENRGMIQLVAAYLKSRQNANGSWDYSGRTDGDTSISQYAVLGMWEAENAGAPVSPTVWDHAAQWYLESQRGGGGWVYHRDTPTAETVSMTAAGVGSLMICRRQLDRYRQKAHHQLSLGAARGRDNSGRLSSGNEQRPDRPGHQAGTGVAGCQFRPQQRGTHGTVDELRALWHRAHRRSR